LSLFIEDLMDDNMIPKMPESLHHIESGPAIQLVN
jgi:hypothetical protein